MAEGRDLLHTVLSACRGTLGEPGADLLVDLIAHATEHIQLVFAAAGRGARIVEIPGDALARARPDARAALGRLVAHDDQVIDRPLAQVVLDALGLVVRDVDADFLHR